jgi:membrane protein
MNSVWEVRAIRGPGLLELVRRKLLTFASAGLCGLLLLASVTATIVLHALAERATAHLTVHWVWLRVGEELSTFGFASLLLVIVYKTLPDASIRWRDVWVGAAVSAGLFVLGKHAIAYYLRHVGVSSTFGAAGAVAAVLIYVQAMAQVLLFGAEFTFVFARAQGRPILPKPGAARVVRTTVYDDPDPDPVV